MKNEKNRLLPTEEAAQRLGLDPEALRARCRRNAKREGREVIARLGAGVVGVKFGTTWRFRIDEVV